MDVLRALKKKREQQKKRLLETVTEQNRREFGWRSSIFYFLISIIFIYGFFHLFYFLIVFIKLVPETDIIIDIYSKVLLSSEPNGSLILGFLMLSLGLILFWKY
jgi:hypothetical protein